jgi:pimeloyl-ACP methyl ester carboxylesterase
MNRQSESFISSRDGTRLYWKEWGTGAPLLFIHGAAVQCRFWDYQVAALSERGFRCIGFDRRGHGRSDQPPYGYDYDSLADDLSDVISALDLRGVTLIGHSMGCAEILRYLTRHGDSRVSGIALLGTTTPFLQQSADNPNGVPAAAFEALRGQWHSDYAKWIEDNTAPFFNEHTSPAMMRWGAGLLEGMSVPIAIACNRTITEADFRSELLKIRVRTLIIHGDRDASAPLEITGRPTAALIPGSELRVYEGGTHGLMFTHMQRLNAELAAFASTAAAKAA